MMLLKGCSMSIMQLLHGQAREKMFAGTSNIAGREKGSKWQIAESKRYAWHGWKHSSPLRIHLPTQRRASGWAFINRKSQGISVI
jgi:hypothetical protein